MKAALNFNDLLIYSEHMEENSSKIIVDEPYKTIIILKKTVSSTVNVFLNSSGICIELLFDMNKVDYDLNITPISNSGIKKENSLKLPFLFGKNDLYHMLEQLTKEKAVCQLYIFDQNLEHISILPVFKSIESINRLKKEMTYFSKLESKAKVAQFVNRNLFGANLRGANLNNIDVMNKDFKKADLQKANMMNANLTDADLRNANLAYANIENTNLSYADLRGADLNNANLKNVNLRYSDLSGAVLTHTNLENANLEGSNLCGADLRFANLKNANLTDATLRGATLENCDLKETLTDTNINGIESVKTAPQLDTGTLTDEVSSIDTDKIQEEVIEYIKILMMLWKSARIQDFDNSFLSFNTHNLIYKKDLMLHYDSLYNPQNSFYPPVLRQKISDPRITHRKEKKLAWYNYKDKLKLLKYLNYIIEIDPNNKEAYEIMEKLYYNIGQKDLAAQAKEKASSLESP